MPEPIASGRFPLLLPDGTLLRMPVKSAVWREDYGRWVHDALFLSEPQQNVKRALILIHGASENTRAQVYMLRGIDAATNAGKEQETLIVAVDLLRKNWISSVISSLLDTRLESSLVHWRHGGMFTGGFSAATSPAPDSSIPDLAAQQIGEMPPRDGTIGVFEVLNQLILYLTRSGDFPNLRSVVVAGQSGGGNCVARYAALGLFDPPALPLDGDLESRTLVLPRPGANIEVRYLVMSAALLYFDDRRFVPDPSLSRTTEFKNATGLSSFPASFEVPSDQTLTWALQQREGQNPAILPSDADIEEFRATYDRYEYGGENISGGSGHYAYGFGLDSARQNFAKRNVTILAGSTDFLDTEVGARYLQGVNAAHRALLYEEHLKETGLWDSALHKVEIVDGVGHSGRQLMLSNPGISALFPPLPAVPCCTRRQYLDLEKVEDFLGRVPVQGPPTQGGSVDPERLAASVAVRWVERFRNRRLPLQE